MPAEILAADVRTQARPPRRLGSSLRCRDAAQTLALARPWMARFGVSRVTDVTRMDRLGLPVCISVRERSLTLHVSAGKGLQPADARVGALMEAIELAVAEPQACPRSARTLRIRELASRWAGRFAFDDLPCDIRRTPRPGDAFECLQCDELVDGEPTWLPADLVLLPFVSPSQPMLLHGSSTGLASGNSLAEATLHGLLEVLERDATTMNAAYDRSRWVDPASLPAPFDGLARDWAALGIALGVRYVPHESGLPCFRAVLHEPASDDVRLAEGAGLHLDRRIAVSRAICEAAQSRLSCIHGGRDDIARYFERIEATGALAHRVRSDRDAESFFASHRTIRFDAVPTVETEGVGLDDLLDGLVQSMPDIGFSSVCRRAFRTGMPDLHVVRVIVPGCEDVDDGPACMGRRLRRRILSHA